MLRILRKHCRSYLSAHRTNTNKLRIIIPTTNTIPNNLPKHNIHASFFSFANGLYTVFTMLVYQYYQRLSTDFGKSSLNPKCHRFLLFKSLFQALGSLGRAGTKACLGPPSFFPRTPRTTESLERANYSMTGNQGHVTRQQVTSCQHFSHLPSSTQD